MDGTKRNFAYIPRVEGGRAHLHAYRSCSGWLAFRDFDFDLKGILPDKTCLLYWLAESRPIALCPACYRMLTDGGAYNV
jgi:hypothetical protein